MVLRIENIGKMKSYAMKATGFSFIFDIDKASLCVFKVVLGV